MTYELICPTCNSTVSLFDIDPLAIEMVSPSYFRHSHTCNKCKSELYIDHYYDDSEEHYKCILSNSPYLKLEKLEL